MYKLLYLVFSSCIFLVRGNQFAVLWYDWRTLFGLGLRFGANHGYLHYDDAVMASLPQLPEGSLLAFPTQAIKAMFSTTFLVSVRNVPKMLNMKAMVVVFTFLFLIFWYSNNPLAAASQVPNKGKIHWKKIRFMLRMPLVVCRFPFGTQTCQPILNRLQGLSVVRERDSWRLSRRFLLVVALLHPLLSVVTSAVTTQP